MPKVRSSVRGEVKRWIEKRVDDQSEISIAALTSDALLHFRVRQDFIDTLLRDSLNVLVAELAREVVANTRGRLLLLGDDVVTQDVIDQRAHKLARRWDNWLEHTGDAHLLLSQMRRVDLFKAAAERRKRAGTELRIATLWDTLASKLDAEQRVSDVFDAQAIDRLYLSVVGSL